ncbi:MAG: hypothetical protein J0L70_11015 [Leptolyngbya sp. UWPOB_LEPTO1]|uniref:hypothetical protein n=1 Tax=Leptolyngbya sp. UWPOB_LEPTO1 TaxID=2815653 RepID=UPI001AC48C91|nr:hypothetical protein [Leptolyngbya sp. UWPOB_LEPTO1]MBN8561046.1 hypothetical protein [Leptolyngbya sp. UWPOB_LEPTO1]
MNRVGLGAPKKPTTKVLLIEPIGMINGHLTDNWAENVLTVDDYRETSAAKRLYLSFHSFCQSLGGTEFDDIEAAGAELLERTGSFFPNLAPFTAVGKVVLDGVNNILNKLLHQDGETKKVEFCLYPVSENRPRGNPGEALLQFGAYVLFFEETQIDNLSLGEDGIVYSSTEKEIPPYIVVNVKPGITLAPGQLDTSAAAEVLQKNQFSDGYRLVKDEDSTLRMFDALKEFGESYKLAQYAERYFELKKKDKQRTEQETQKFNELSKLLKDKFSDWDA